MMTLLIVWSYCLITVGTAAPIGLFGVEVIHRVRAGQPLVTWFIALFAIVTALTVVLEWITWAILNFGEIELTWLFCGIVALWLASMVAWIYETLKHATTLLVVKSSEETRRYVREVLP